METADEKIVILSNGYIEIFWRQLQVHSLSVKFLTAVLIDIG